MKLGEKQIKISRKHPECYILLIYCDRMWGQPTSSDQVKVRICDKGGIAVHWSDRFTATVAAGLGQDRVGCVHRHVSLCQWCGMPGSVTLGQDRVGCVHRCVSPCRCRSPPRCRIGIGCTHPTPIVIPHQQPVHFFDVAVIYWVRSMAFPGRT